MFFCDMLPRLNETLFLVTCCEDRCVYCSLCIYTSSSLHCRHYIKPGKEGLKRWVFRRLHKSRRDAADVTWRGVVVRSRHEQQHNSHQMVHVPLSTMVFHAWVYSDMQNDDVFARLHPSCPVDDRSICVRSATDMQSENMGNCKRRGRLQGGSVVCVTRGLTGSFSFEFADAGTYLGGSHRSHGSPPLREHERIRMSHWYENFMICQIRYCLLYKHVTNMCSLQSMHCWTFQSSFLYRLLLQNVLSQHFDC